MSLAANSSGDSALIGAAGGGAAIVRVRSRAACADVTDPASARGHRGKHVQHAGGRLQIVRALIA